MEFKPLVGFYQYNTETRLRVVGVQATDVILPKNPTPRDGSVQPLALHSRTGLVNDRPLHTERGHLIGLQFGGPESTGNLVPMYGGFNSAAGAWQVQFETPLKEHLNYHGRAVDLEISVSYADKQTPIPDKFLIKVAAKRGGALPQSLARDILLLHPPPTAFYMKPDDFINLAGPLLQRRQDAMEQANWSVELQAQSSGIRKELQVGGLNPKNIDFTVKKQKDAFYFSRPYAVLDFIYFNFPKEYELLGGPHLSGGINNVTKFSHEQAMFILKMNVVRYRGYMDSDMYGLTPYEKVRHLMPASSDYQAEVDHSMARSGAGSNAYSNARVISSGFNKALNHKETNQKVEQSLKDLAGI
ncbi:MAG: hypothetical protein GVY13_12250 [Alphaproteobacteria bacterium]|jgi:hypothetical protein|nr:hypothetical protein [Alphaproteobacteria bacterium]